MATLNLERINDNYKFKVSDIEGNEVTTDSTMDGKAEGMSPMEMLLAATASCSGIDVVMILKKQRQKLDDIKIRIEAEKVKKGTYSEWKSLHMHFDLYGDIKESKAAKALELSIEQYCSVAMAMKKTTKITYSHTVHQTVVST